MGEHTKRDRPFGHQEHQQRPSISTPSAAGVGADQQGLASENDGAEDDAGAKLEDPDVLAPSDLHLNPSKGQTGLHQSTIHNIEKENKESSGAFRDTASFKCSHEKAVSSDEDDYDGVDLISESGEEAPTAPPLRERAFIDFEDDNAVGLRPGSPPNTPTEAFMTDSAGWGQVDFSIDPFLTDDIFFKEQINLLDPPESLNDTGFFESANDFTFTPPLAETPRRRVRFAEPLMLPLGASEPFLPALLEAGASPARLCDKSSSTDNVDPPRSDYESYDGQNMANGEGVGLGARTGGGFPFETFASMDDEEDEEDYEGSVGSSSGYETDEGETTDEEDVPACATTRPSAVLRDSSASALNDGFANQPVPQTPTPKLPPGRRWGPTLGSWVADPTKSMAVVASSGKHLIIRPAQRPASRGTRDLQSILSSGQSSVQASPRPSVANMARPSHPTATDDSDMDRSEISSQEIATPMLSASPNVMMSGLAFGSGNLLSGHAMGPPQAFFPFQTIEAGGQMVLDGLDDDYDDDDEDGEDLLNIEDFIDFGEDSEGSDHEVESTAGSSQSPALTSPTEAVAKTASVPSSPSQSSFLDHLDKVVVTAFRRNQYDRDTNSFGSPGKSPFRAANAIQGNSFLASNTPFGSSKKRKLAGSFGAPLGQNHTFTKRRMLNRHREQPSGLT
ncbi:MAG: hypothetical protein Q9186_002893 [Xanthomendoza sp. 1 TL-2023]